MKFLVPFLWIVPFLTPLGAHAQEVKGFAPGREYTIECNYIFIKTYDDYLFGSGSMVLSYGAGGVTLVRTLGYQVRLGAAKGETILDDPEAVTALDGLWVPGGNGFTDPALARRLVDALASREVVAPGGRGDDKIEKERAAAFDFQVLRVFSAALSASTFPFEAGSRLFQSEPLPNLRVLAVAQGPYLTSVSASYQSEGLKFDFTVEEGPDVQP